MSALEDRLANVPRLLHDLCDGCPNIREELYAVDYPSGVRLWYCRNCYWSAQRSAEGAPKEKP